MAQQKRRVRVYVDGFNFYYGLRTHGLKRYYWINLCRLFEQFMYSSMRLEAVTYFTAPPIASKKRERQQMFLKANKADPRFSVINGSFLFTPNPANPSNPSDGKLEEKKTDVNLSIAMIDDVVNDRCDVTFLVTGDTDQCPTLAHIRKIKPGHQIFTVFPFRFNNELKQLSTAVYQLKDYTARMDESVMDVAITMPNGRTVRCPEEWLIHHPSQTTSH